MSDPIPTSSPNVKLGPAKAIIAAIAGAAVAAGPLLIEAVADGALDVGEAWAVIGALLAGAGITGSATYLKSTTVTLK